MNQLKVSLLRPDRFEPFDKMECALSAETEVVVEVEHPDGSRSTLCVTVCTDGSMRVGKIVPWEAPKDLVEGGEAQP